MIFREDLAEVLRYLESQTGYFHNARLNTVFTENDQSKPTKYLPNQYFVISKILVSHTDLKTDPANRQIFHHFDQSSPSGQADLFALKITETPNGICPVVNAQELEWLADKYDKIEQQRKTENEKLKHRALENDKDVEPRHC